MSASFAPERHPVTLAELVREVPGRVTIAGDSGVRVAGVRHDSRTVEPGDLFVARTGHRADGLRFVADAVARGAVAIMALRGALDAATPGVPVVFVDDVVAGLAHAAAAVYAQPSFSLEVVGITGTNGKTTTAHLVRDAVDAAIGQPVCGVLGTVGHSFGAWSAGAENTTPEADDVARAMDEMRTRGATHVAMEVSSHALSLGRVQAIRFRVAALTNLTQDHLDFHGSMDAYAAAKATLFTELGPGAAVLNVDDALGRDLAARLQAPRLHVPCVRVSSVPGATGVEVAPRTARVDGRGVDAVVATPAGEVRIVSRLLGRHNLDNLLLALGVAHSLELDVVRAADGLSRAAAPPGRLERCDAEGDDVVVVVDYAHTPDALERVLDALRPVTAGRLWCVFGCGGDRDPTKRGPMGRAAARRADAVVVTSDNPRSEDPAAIAASVVAGVRGEGVEPRIELDRRRAVDLAVTGAAPGDTVLIAGKGHEDYQVIGAVKHPFDDRTEARLALESRRTRRGT
jgi:UDP-N-acetylmuramoyl-L-alanyl-D-glutamate--2,6-diaminopimelate ligase